MSRPRLIALLLAFATLLVFLPVGGFSFVNYDDPDYVTDNGFVRHGLTATDIHWAFTTFHASNWHPLTWLSLMLDCQLFGPNAGALHFINVFWHALNVALLFTWLVRLTNRLWPAAFIAALFAWHPLHVESVAWISERKDVLSTFFALLTLLAYTKYVQEKNRRCLWLALLFFALGLMAKPMLVTLPFVLLLLDFWPLKRLPPFSPFLLVEKIPFLVLTLISCGLTIHAQHQGEAVVSLAMVPPEYRLENALVSLMTYLQKLFLPVGLCAMYPMPARIPGWQVALAAAILISVSALAWHGRKTRPYFLMGWLWFLGTLVPVIGLVQVGVQAMADRYMYLPSIGLFIGVIFLAADLVERIETPEIIRIGFATLVCAGCVLATEYYLPAWRDSESTFRRALAVTPDNDVAYVDLGAELEQQGRLDEALEEFRAALRIRPGWYQIHNNLANILDEQGLLDQAAAEYRQAIQLDPRISFLHKNLGLTLVEQGRYDEALKEFSTAEQLDPASPDPHFETARLYLAQGRDLDALIELRNAIQLQPDNPRVLAFTARVLASDETAGIRSGPLALQFALKANALAGNQAVILDALGMACAENGDYANAQQCARETLQLAAAAGLNDTNALQARLDLYQKNQPWRESFRATRPPVKSP